MRTGLLLGLALLFSGGASATLPVGSVVIYSDGTVEKLQAVEAGSLRWEDDRKRLFVRSTNPILPVLEKRDFLSGRGYRQRVVSGNPDQIRDLPEGTPLEFSMLRDRSDGRSGRRHWECVFLGETEQQVLGQARMLERYTCERFVLHRKFHNRWFREKRDFTYSRDLGLVVDLQRETRNRRTHIALVAIYPPQETGYKQISRAVRKVCRAD